MLALSLCAKTMVIPNSVSSWHCSLGGQGLQSGHMPAPNLSIGVAVTLNYRVLYVTPCEVFCWWAVSAVRSDVCPSLWLGLYSNWYMCDYLPLTPGQESLWGGAGPCWGCLQNDRCLALFYLNSCRAGQVGWDSP